ncbi:MAG: hypothetical protein AABX24_05460 [Nanoarchaeota archaeon]
MTAENRVSKKVGQLSQKTGQLPGKISWCLNQKNGIELIEPNDNLSLAYFTDADDSLLAMEKNTGKWRIVTAYYACYNALYALLMKAGIKCEIHDCTLALMFFFEFKKEEEVFTQALKKQRIDVQYYLKPASEIDTDEVKKFVIHCKILAKALVEEKVREIRNHLAKND